MTERTDGERTGRYVLGFHEIDQTQVAVVGGKGAHLGELARIEGVRVPAGFCVTTDAFRRIMAEAPSIDDLLDRLSQLSADDREAIRTLSARSAAPSKRSPCRPSGGGDHRGGRPARRASRLRRAIERYRGGPADGVLRGPAGHVPERRGPAAILEHVSRCWASLFTERAVTYRLRNGIDHRQVQMAVVVQRMVFPDVAGILFTADPVTGNRKVASVEASFGLGEALVSGLVNADGYKVRDGEVVAKAVGTKQLAVRASPDGGTEEQAIEPAAAEAAGADGRAGRAARAAGPPDRSALRLSSGHRMVPGRRRLPDRPEPADHDAVPDSRSRRPGEPRLRLRRSPADDDRPHEAARALLLADDDSRVRWPRPAAGCSSTSPEAWRRRRAARPSWTSSGKPIRWSGTHCRRFSTAATSSRRCRTRAPAGAAWRRRRRLRSRPIPRSSPS